MLCKDNRTISVIEVLRSTYLHGQINLGVMVLRSGHLLPTYETDYPYDNFLGSDTDSEPEMTLDYLQIGEAAALLSHRHMTRNQDDIIIWGYLIGNTFLRDGIQLWRSRIGQSIPTSSIVSSSPRIKGFKGLSWAPERPTFRHASNNASLSQKAYMVSEESSLTGKILEQGLRASWFFREVTIQRDLNLEDQLKSFPSEAIEAIKSRKNQYAHFALLRARSRDSSAANMPVVYRETGQGPLVVLCASHNRKEGWEWVDVFEWVNNFEWVDKVELEDSQSSIDLVDGFKKKGVLLI